jgi:hypothetical protein
MKKIIILKLFVCLSLQAFAGYTTEVLETFDEVVEYTESEVLNYGSESIFVVFDIDRTILETTDCLSPDQVFSNGFLKFEAKVRQCHGELTSPLVPVLIEDLKAQNVPVMALTARRSTILEETLSQLEDRLWVTEEGKEEASVSFETSPLYTNRVKTIKFKQPGKKGMLDKELVVRRGVATASGADKGLGLLAYLKRVEREKNITFDRIVFIDDDRKNIRDLEDAFSDTDVFISILHYVEHEK